MLPLFLGLLILERRHPSRALRVGTWVALAGQVMLTVMELVAITARDAAIDDSTGTLVGALYSLPMLLLGVGPWWPGSVRCGSRLFDGPARWLLLALGVYVFVVMFPAVFGPMVAGRDRDRRVAAGLRLAGPRDRGITADASRRVAGAAPSPGVALGVALDDHHGVVLVEPHVDRRTVGLGDLDLPGRAVLGVALDALASRRRSPPARRRSRRRPAPGCSRGCLLAGLAASGDGHAAAHQRRSARTTPPADCCHALPHDPLLMRGAHHAPAATLKPA